MIIIYCSKPQQNDAVTPTPLAHRSQTCMRALALGHDTPQQGSRGPTSTRWSLSLISDNAGPGKTFVKPSANMNLVPIQSTVISSSSTASLTLTCSTCMCLERSLETGFTAIRLALLLSPHSVGLLASMAESVQNFFSHISSFAAVLIPISSAPVVCPAMMSCLLDLQNTQFPYIISIILPDTLFKLSAFVKSASDYAPTTLFSPPVVNCKPKLTVFCRYLIVVRCM